MTIRLATTAAVFAATLAVTWAADSKDKAGQPADQKGDPGQAVQKFVKQHDKNGDNSLTRDELPATLREGFEDMDASKDGKLSADELRSYAARLVFIPVPVEIVSYYVIDAATSAPSRDELQSVYEMLRKADGNNDGKLSEDELKAARDHAIQQRIDSVFKRCDKNNDGKVAKDECPDDMKSLFNQADKDNNGAITKEELKACCTKSAERAGQAAGGSRKGDK